MTTHRKCRVLLQHALRRATRASCRSVDTPSRPLRRPHFLDEPHRPSASVDARFNESKPPSRLTQAEHEGAALDLARKERAVTQPAAEWREGGDFGVHGALGGRLVGRRGEHVARLGGEDDGHVVVVDVRVVRKGGRGHMGGLRVSTSSRFP